LSIAPNTTCAWHRRHLTSRAHRSQAITHHRARPRQHVTCPTTGAGCAGKKGSTGLILVADRPVHVAELVLLQEPPPEPCLLDVEDPCPVSLARSPLRNHQRRARTQGG